MKSTFNTRNEETFRSNGMHKNYNHYFGTVQKAQKKQYCSAEMLELILSKVESNNSDMTIYNSIFELGKLYQQLHLHFVCRLKSKLSYKDNSKIGDYRIYWRPVYNFTILFY